MYTYYHKKQKNYKKYILIGLFVIIAIFGGYRAYQRITYVPPQAPLFAPEKTMRIIEGWDVYDIADYLDAQKIVTRDAFLQFVGSPTQKGNFGFRDSSLMKKYPFLKEIPNGVSLEGYLFPDTYRVFEGASVEEVVDRMLENFNTKFDEQMRADMKAQHKKMFEIVTMASIIEIEVHGKRDRALVSDILWSRLKIGMALQVDSSVNYVTRKNNPAVTIKDTRYDSPFNTYLYRGLPLGPISNPGLESLKAALHPESNPYVYFLTTKEGEVKYAKSLEEHNKNKFQYLK